MTAAGAAAAGAAGPEPILGELDLHLIGEGRHERLWEVLGSHVRDGGATFAVWAPNARGVAVVGDFNGWSAAAHPLRPRAGSGVWEGFVPGVADGARYPHEVVSPDGTRRRKADPLAVRAEPPPGTASVVAESSYRWGDGEWMAQRTRRPTQAAPMSVYEVHPGSWRAGRGFRELAAELVAYVTDLGFTHVELLPVMAHPYGGSWGYQVTSYYAPTARLGSPDDLRYLVDCLHRAGVGVLLDWVPSHFPRDEWALARFDGTPQYEHADPRRGEQPDWGTLVFDLGRPQVRNFLLASALYWLEEFHADGLRVDAVASMLYLDYSRREGEWLPNVHGGKENLEAIAFLRELNATCYRRAPGIVMVAEESTTWPGVTRPVQLGGLGFGCKWNMGWMHDVLDYLRHDPIHRQYHHQQLTFSFTYAFGEHYVLPISHDEVVHGKGSLLRKMPGDRWQQLANLRAFLAFMWAHPGKQLLFMGSEFAQEAEWAEAGELDWALAERAGHAGVRRLVRDLNRCYRAHRALWAGDGDPASLRWIHDDAAGNVVAFLRYAPGGQALACVANFAGVPHHDYRLGLPRAGRWREVLNTDATPYGGSGLGNAGHVEAGPPPRHGQPASARMVLPPLAMLWLASPVDPLTPPAGER